MVVWAFLAMGGHDGAISSAGSNGSRGVSASSDDVIARERIDPGGCLRGLRGGDVTATLMLFGCTVFQY